MQEGRAETEFVKCMRFDCYLQLVGLNDRFFIESSQSFCDVSSSQCATLMCPCTHTCTMDHNFFPFLCPTPKVAGRFRGVVPIAKEIAGDQEALQHAVLGSELARRHVGDASIARVVVSLAGPVVSVVLGKPQRKGPTKEEL